MRPKFMPMPHQTDISTRSAKNIANGRDQDSSISRPVGIVSCACISIRSNLCAIRSRNGGSPSGTDDVVRRRMFIVSPIVRPRPINAESKIDRPALGAGARIGAKQRFGDQDNCAESADKDERFDPDRTHDSNFASGRNSRQTR